VAVEALRVAGEEKDASVLQLQQEVDTAHVELEKERK
jgi:hypothetical protein